MPTFSAPGVGSNLDVNGIVGQLMTAERRPLALLAQQEAQLQGKLSAFGRLNGALAALQTAARSLDSLERFRAYKASASDAGIVAASASSGATAGTYSVEVLTLAQNHKLRSGPFAAATDTVGSGTLTFQYGTYDSGANTFALNAAKAAQTVSIGAGQGTLAGVRDAVNAAGIGVTASLVNDGSEIRLIFTSKDSGLANSLRITVADADGTHTDANGLSALAYNPTAAAGSGKNLTETGAAADATLKVDGIAVAHASNTVTGAIEGVTLNLLKAEPGTAISVAVVRDADGVRSSVQAFVKAYNDLAATLKTLAGYNAETRQGGTLQGDAAPLALVNRLRGQLASAVSGAPSTMATLSQLGVTAQKDGTLGFDTAKFNAAAAAGFDDIAGLFTRLGRASLPAHVSYLGAGANTQSGLYSINVTQVATRGSLAGNAAAGLTITEGVNDTLSLTVDGVSATVTLGAGTYASASALAAELQTRANGIAAFASAGISVAVSDAAGVLTLTSNRYGAESNVSAAAGAGASALFGAAPVAAAGLDAAGTINGIAAAASGQILTGAQGSAAEGLQLKVCPSVPGTCGTVAFTIGQAPQLNAIAEEFLATTGSLAGRVSGLNTRLKDIDRRKTAFNQRMDKLEQRYRAQFTALDAMIARMQNTSSFLTNQIAALPKSGSL